MKKLRYSIMLLLLANVGFAEDMAINGTIKQTIHLTDKSNTLATQSTDQEKEITLLNVELSERTLNKIEAGIKNSAQHSSASLLGASTKAQLGMGKVPVLDQGSHGTCVTFAVTAALDAALDKGDYISQLCSLELSRNLASISYDTHYWNGTWGPNVLNQLTRFGIVSKDNQRKYGCGGMTEYPLKGDDPESEISAADYHQISEELNSKTVTWSSVLEIPQYLYDKVDSNTVLNSVRTAINAGDRLTFQVLLIAIDQGVVGAVGKYHTNNDSWVLSSDVVNNMSPYGGHQMVITGYDDSAEAVDKNGKRHKGLLTLRNSWGSSSGDKGDFYMSYDYFKELTPAVQRIRHVVPK